MIQRVIPWEKKNGPSIDISEIHQSSDGLFLGGGGQPFEQSSIPTRKKRKTNKSRNQFNYEDARSTFEDPNR